MTRFDRSGRKAASNDKRRRGGGRGGPSLPRAAAALVAAAALLATSLAPALAAPPAAADGTRYVAMPAHCDVPDETAMIDAPLPRLAKRLRAAEPMTIVVIGSGSAAGTGTSRREAAFPARFEARLQKAFPKPKVRLVVLAAMGQTATASLARFAKEIVPLKPALVIWQTGSADAARGVPVMEFGNALERGIGDLRDLGSDVVLVDSQFGPRASLLVNTDAYREAVRWNARRYDLPLLKRYDTMQYWWSHDVFDLDAEDKAVQLENADRIHDCIAALLVRTIEHATASGARS